MKGKSVENAYVTVWIEDGVIVILYKKDAVIGLEAAKEIVSLCEDLVQGVVYPSLIYIKHLKVVSVQARKYFASIGNPKVRVAAMVDSGFSRILGNMFLMVDRPVTPVKLFTNKEEAIKWIKEGQTKK